MGKVTYFPPPEDMVHQFAQELCHRLSQIDEGYNDPEVVRGFRGCLSVVARVLANNLNREHGEVDNANK